MRNKYLALLFLIILASMSYIYFGRNMIKQGRIKVAKIEKTIKKEQEKLNSAKVLNEQLQEVSRVIRNSMTEEDTYSSDEVNQFITVLGEMADRFRIKVVGVSPRPSSKENKILEQSYAMEIICNYVQLGQFLAEMERLDYIMNLNTLDVKPMATDEDEQTNVTRYKVSIELSTFKIIKEA